jgi:hypothetical protein
MHRDKLITVGLFLLLLSAAAGMKVLHGESVSESAGPAGRDWTAGEFRGINLQLHNGFPGHPYETYIDEIAETGANTICLVINAWQENCSSTSIFIDLRKTPPDRRVVELIRHARLRGLRVVVMPILLLENARSGEWRGKIQPEKDNWDDWWEDYTNYVLHYAHLAEEGGAELFMVGSELVSTESQADRWRGLIARVRGAFGGRLSYSANWDHYKPITWWDDLDLVGITTYNDLTGGEEPTLERLEESWRKIRAEILQWQESIGLPILFTEVGWPNQVTCAQYPWDYYRSDTPDPQAQANCFRAFFRTWADRDEVAGWLVWEWRSYPQQPIGPEDTSYVPCGKPAMEVIRKYLNRPDATSEAAAQPQAPEPLGG